MPRFFTDSFFGDTISIIGDDFRHITKSLRMQIGDIITVCDGVGSDYICKISDISDFAVSAAVTEKILTTNEPTAKISLYQALPKGEKLDFIAQKSTELGISNFIPVLTSRCVSRPDAKSMLKKQLRLEKIVRDAAGQSERSVIPQIAPLLTFNDAIISMKASDLAIIFFEHSQIPLRQILTACHPDTISIMIGSEGGFSDEEIAFATQNNIAVASLGKRILRCETAPITALSAILFALGEF